MHVYVFVRSSSFVKRTEYLLHIKLFVVNQISHSQKQADSVPSQDFKVRGQTRILRCEVVEGVRERGTRHFPNEVKIQERQPSYYTCIGLVCETPGCVAHIKRTGRSVDLSVEIATGRRRMIDIISTPGRLTVVQYGA